MADEATATPPTIPAQAAEVNPMVDALNKLVAGLDEKNRAALETQSRMLADAFSKQAEILQGVVAGKNVAPQNIPATPPAAAKKEIDVGPVIQRIFSDSTFRDRVVALHASFPAGS